MASSSSQSVLVIDDADSRLLYSPATSWTTAGNALLEYRGTTHALSTGSGLVNFRFNGTKVEIYGTVGPTAASNPIACAVDGSAIQLANTVTAPLTSPLYHQLFCSGTVPDNQEHELVVTINATPAQTFFLDYILYSYPAQSTHNAVPGGATATVVVDDRQADQVSFSDGWGLGGALPELDGTTHGTNTVNATSTFKFKGTNVEVYGTVAADLTKKWVTTYSIDQGKATSVDSSSFQALADIHNIRFFGSDNLPDGDHTLTITYTEGALPYWLDYFVFVPSPTFGVVVETGSTSTSTSSTTSTSTSSTTSPSTLPTNPATETTPPGSNPSIQSNQSDNNNNAPTGTIIGATVGAILGLLALLAVVWFLLRRKRSSRDSILFPATERIDLSSPSEPLYPPQVQKQQSYGTYGTGYDNQANYAYPQQQEFHPQRLYGQPQPLYGQPQMYGNQQPVTYGQPAPFQDLSGGRPNSQHSLGYLRQSGADIDQSQNWSSDGASQVQSHATTPSAVTSASHPHPPTNANLAPNPVTGAGPPPYKN